MIREFLSCIIQWWLDLLVRRRARVELWKGRLFNDTIEDMQREANTLREQLRLKELEIEQLHEIISRDRERVAAETAIASRRIAEATTKPQLPDI